VVGVLNTVVAYLVYSLLVYLGFGYIIALIMDYLVGMCLGFLLNKRYTFKVRAIINTKQVLKTIFSNVLLFFINVVILFVMIDFYDFNVYYSQLIALILISISSFLFYKFFVFSGLSTND
jgi:putative flippase GtrA